MNVYRVYAAGIVTTIVASYAMGVASRRLRQKTTFPASRAAEPTMPMPHAMTFKAARGLRPAFRVLVVFLVLTIAAAQSGSTVVSTRFLTVVGGLLLVACVGLAILGLAIDATLRCSGCSKRMLLQSVESPPFPPPVSQRNVRQTGIFQCMYCGQRYSI